MPLHPLLVPIVEAIHAAPPPPPDASLDELRASSHRDMEQSFLYLFEDGPELDSVVDRRVPVAGGAITIRIYRPHDERPLPAHVYLHGGGFWLGTLDHFDAACRTLARDANCVVASVDYRLAPEHKFPTAAEDCYAAFGWVIGNAGALGVDPARISIGGGSAGGNLAAAVSLMARDRRAPRPLLQVLEIPALDFTMSHPSVRENADRYGMTLAGLRQCYDYYLANPADAKHPYASPIFADDLSDLPPAVIMTAEFDPLRDEGEAYGERLRAAGIATVVERWPGMIHGSMGFTKLLPEARRYRARVAELLRHAYAGCAVV